MGKKFSELERAVGLNNGDLAAFAQVDQSAPTGYKSKAAPMSLVSQKILKDTEYASDLQTDDKTVLGAINEVNSRTIIYDVVSGPIANFKTSLELPIKSLGIDVNAVQAAGTPTPASPLPISGWSEINLYKLGCNLVQHSKFVAVTSAFTYGYRNEGFPLKGGVTYTFSINVAVGSLRLISVDEQTVYAQSSNGLTVTYTPPTDTLVVFRLWKAEGMLATEFKLEVGASATPYEPYNGNTEVINLGGTYYGGHFTQDKDGHRQFEVTSRIASYTGESGEAWMMFTVSQGNLFRIQASDRKDGYITESNCKCNSYKPVSQAQRTNETVSGTGLMLDFINNNFSSVEDWKTNLADNPIQIVYELATPYTIDLPDGDPIITLKGTNNIYADSGDASVEYALTIKDYIDKEIASVQALILNS